MIPSFAQLTGNDVCKSGSPPEKGSGGIADGIPERQDPKLVHDSCRFKIVCMDETK